MKNKKSTKFLKTLILSTFLIPQIFALGLPSVAKADCSYGNNFDYSPKASLLSNSSITLTANVAVAGCSVTKVGVVYSIFPNPPGVGNTIAYKSNTIILDVSNGQATGSLTIPVSAFFTPSRQPTSGADTTQYPVNFNAQLAVYEADQSGQSWVVPLLASPKNSSPLTPIVITGGSTAPATQATNQQQTQTTTNNNQTAGTGALPAPAAYDCSAANADPNKCLFNPLPEESLTSVSLYIVKGTIEILGVFAALFIVVGGFQMVMAAGNEETYLKARKTITWAVLGLVLAVMSFSIIAIVQNLLGATIQYKPQSQIEQNIKPV